MYRNLRNRFDFALRGILRAGFPISAELAHHPLSLKFQDEVREFFSLFDWVAALSDTAKDREDFLVADIGTRTFSTAKVLDQVFRDFNPIVYGIEIDAYRRFTNFHTRADYGSFHASEISRGFYVAQDFLKWSKPLHVATLLHPFVTKEPLLNWGLPLSVFKPLEIFKHAFELLEKQNGVLVLSCPHEEEFVLSQDFAQKTGFYLSQEKTWRPSPSATQKKPRFGGIFKIN